MGSGSFDAAAYRSFAASTTGKTTDEIYTSREIKKELNPKGVKLRESRDSADNPNSTPLIVALDVTGSMGSRIWFNPWGSLNVRIRYSKLRKACYWIRTTKSFSRM